LEINGDVFEKSFPIGLSRVESGDWKERIHGWLIEEGMRPGTAAAPKGRP
jgi:hypothetical protein